MRVLLAEDDQVLSKSISNRMSKLGFVVDIALDGSLAEQFLKTLTYDLVILDLNMPKTDGRVVLNNLRSRGILTPVLVLTARAQLEDKVNVLNLGADDYLTKPFDFEELEARCRALLRRSHGLANDKIEHGDLSSTGKLAPFILTLYLLVLLILNIGYSTYCYRIRGKY